MKYCPHCQTEKELAEFYPMRVKRKDGSVQEKLASYCRKCSNAKVAEHQRKRYQTDPAYKARHNQRAVDSYRRRRATDPEYVKTIYERRKHKELEKKQEQAALGLLPPKLCVDCGVDISERSPLTRYCSDCKQARRYAAVRKYVESHRKVKSL